MGRSILSKSRSFIACQSFVGEGLFESAVHGNGSWATRRCAAHVRICEGLGREPDPPRRCFTALHRKREKRPRPRAERCLARRARRRRWDTQRAWRPWDTSTKRHAPGTAPSYVALSWGRHAHPGSFRAARHLGRRTKGFLYPATAHRIVTTSGLPAGGCVSVTSRARVRLSTVRNDSATASRRVVRSMYGW